MSVRTRHHVGRYWGSAGTALSAVAASLPSGVTLQAIDGESMLTSATSGLIWPVMSLNYFSREKNVSTDTFTFATNKATYSFSLDDPTFFFLAVINAINFTTGAGAADNDVPVAQALLSQVSLDVGSGIVASNQPGYGIMAIPSAAGPSGGTPDQAIGVWTVGLHMDETIDIPGEILSIPNATQDHRFWDYTGTWQLFNGGSWQGMTIPQMLSAGQYPTASGPNRSIDVLSVDLYFFAASATAFWQGALSNMLSGAPTITTDDMARGSNYGNMIDVFRAWATGFDGASRDLTSGAQSTARLPFTSLPENTNGFITDTGNRLITPQEYQWACWSAIIHGARGLYPFLCCNPQSTNENGYDNITAVGGITMYNQALATHTLLYQLAPVLNSPFALGFVTAVSPHGYLFPVYESNWLNGGIECCTHWYHGGNVTNRGLDLVNGFYIFATTRDSETATSISATFTVAAGSVANVVGESRSINIVGGQFTDTFANAWTAHIYQIS